MAKDTEKLIRQLSLISYLMAERRPVTALEIRRDVEGYSGMNEDAFARRFYADRAELDSLGIQLTVDRPPDAVAEQENYSLRPEEFHLPAIAFTDGELAALHRAVAARRRVRLRRAAAPRAAADHLGPPEPAAARPSSSRSRWASPPRPAATSCRSAWRRSRPRSSATRRSSSTTTRWSATRRAPARSTRTTCCSRAGSSTSSATPTSATRSASSACRASAARSPTRRRPSTTSGARRQDFDPREYANRADVAVRRDASDRRDLRLRAHRVAGRAPLRPLRRDPTRRRRLGRASRPPYASARMVASWVLRLGEHAQVLGPPELADEVAERVALLVERHADGEPGARRARRPAQLRRRRRGHGRREPPRPAATPRSAPSASRASSRSRPILIEAGRARRAARRRRASASACRSPTRELREDINVLNVVNFGGGSYVLYAEVTDDGHDRGRPRALLGQLRAPGAAAARRGQGARRRDRPDRRAPARGLADVGAREDRRRARRGPDGAGPAGRERRRRRLRHRARRLARRSPPAGCCELDYYKPNEDEFVRARRRAVRADERARGLVRRRRSTRRATTSATSAWTASATRR